MTGSGLIEKACGESSSSFNLLPLILRYDGVAWPSSAVVSTTAIENLDDEHLLHYLQKGNQEQKADAFSVVYNRYYPDVVRFLRRKVNAEQVVKDLFSRVWIIAYTRLDTFEWRGKPIKGWLLSIAATLCAEHFRKIKGENTLEDAVEDVQEQAIGYIDQRLQTLDNDALETPPDDVQAAADQIVAGLLEKLPNQERQIIQLIFFEGKNSTEIGQMLSLKPGTVRQKHSRGLEKLRKLLEKGSR